jgi:squalene-hopene/tetraprenyl-beta-curcumene cyclase
MRNRIGEAMSASMTRAWWSYAAVMTLAAVPSLSADWNPQLAAEYLDSRQQEWFAWRTAQAPGGPCLSCHTGLTYLLARPVLRQALGEGGATSYEIGLTAGLRARVEEKHAKELFAGFAKEPMASQALGTESVLAALLLTVDDSSHSDKLSSEAEKAFGRLWALQIQEGEGKGAWAWFSLNLDPWEMPESRFFGAALAALAVGSAPPEYRARPQVAKHVSALTAYLNSEQAAQPLHNRLMLLWASAKLPEALPAAATKAIAHEAWRKQSEDGGWTLEALGPWKQHPAAAPTTGSNGYATAFTAFVLQKAGGATTNLKRALEWLRANQDREAGFWPAQSMNKRYEPGSMEARFMQDAATAFAAMTLVEARHAAPAASKQSGL